MNASQKLAIAAHLHVLLRRKTGRVTDTEWMSQNLDYAVEIVRFARLKADEDRLPELREWADKLETAVLAPVDPLARQPLVQTAVQLLRDRGGVAPLASGTLAPGVVDPAATEPGGSATPSEFADSQPDGDKARRDPSSPRYVGGIR